MFQLIARFFTLFGDNMHAAALINSMSALCSALTIFFLYLTIVWFAKRLFKTSADGTYTVGQAVAIMGSGLVGALAYILVLRRGGRGICHVFAFHCCRVLVHDSVV